MAPIKRESFREQPGLSQSKENRGPYPIPSVQGTSITEGFSQPLPKHNSKHEPPRILAKDKETDFRGLAADSNLQSKSRVAFPEQVNLESTVANYASDSRLFIPVYENDNSKYQTAAVSIPSSSTFQEGPVIGGQVEPRNPRPPVIIQKPTWPEQRVSVLFSGQAQSKFLRNVLGLNYMEQTCSLVTFALIGSYKFHP